jgi:Holliday junction resolvasome RuvABC endonuclease subunit
MILGIDTGLATCGWALLDERSKTFVDMGVLVQKPTEGRTITLDRLQRSNALAKVLATKAPGCSTVIVEQLNLGMPGAIAKLSVGLSWGVVLGIVAMLDPRPRLMTIAPQRWQRAVLPNTGKTVDYDELARAAAKLILTRHPRAAASLESIPQRHRSHAIDAAMIALVGALRPRDCTHLAA